MKGVFFVTGIDTNIGKSYATGFLAREWKRQGVNVITQKLVQTGNEGRSEDIELHRRIMQGGKPFPEDLQHLTYPIVYTYPSSPHLAAEIDHAILSTDTITHATEELARRYDVVLLEGAGGPMVPLTRELLTIDYIAAKGYPVILVTSGRLGSISHTLLCIEAIERRNLPLHTIVYNRYPATDALIENDTIGYLRNYLSQHHPETALVEMPEIAL